MSWYDLSMILPFRGTKGLRISQCTRSVLKLDKSPVCICFDDNENTLFWRNYHVPYGDNIFFYKVWYAIWHHLSFVYQCCKGNMKLVVRILYRSQKCLLQWIFLILKDYWMKAVICEYQLHYSHVTLASWRLKSPATQLLFFNCLC